MRGVLGLMASLALAACAAVPWPQAVRARDGQGTAPGLRDLRGVVHVHTRGSHDSPGTLEAVVRAARSAGLSWVALTEHRKPGILPAHGRIHGVTVIPGFEVRAAGGSILALGVSERLPRLADPAELVGWVHAAGGAAFLGHLERSRLAEPSAYARLGLDGVEIANLHAVARERRLRLALGMLLLPGPVALRTLLHPPRANLVRWDALAGAHAIVGGVDAHARYRLLGPLGGTFDRYRDVFRALTTHVLAPDAAAASVLAALRAGRSYVAFEGLGVVERFRFEREGDGFRLVAPRAARLALVCDGREVASEEAESARLAAPAGARACRGEAWRDGRLWILSSRQPLEAPPGRE